MAHFTGTRLSCVRGERKVFEGLDFTLDAGDMLVLVGPNGSGKSSLLRLMAGLARPAAGVLRWDGVDIAEDPEAHHTHLHYVGHTDALKPVLTVAENLGFWAALHGGAPGARSRVADALDAFGIKSLADVPARYLSAGQRRRLALARTLAADAPLWLLDEPTTALDADAVAALEGVIARHRECGGMVVAATHGPLGTAEVTTLDLRNARPADTAREGAA